MSKIRYTPLPDSFYTKPTLELSKALLGCLLVHQTDEGTTAGMIVETEAYLGASDKASHSFERRRTKRTEVMFGKAGLAYTHRMHTHCLVNVVSGELESPEAILIRAIEPYDGIDLMMNRRPVSKFTNLTSGPGKLTKAMGISMEYYGHAFTNPPLFIAKGKEPEHISQGKRIGIDGAGEARDYPLRFWVTGNRFVSR